MALHLFIFRIEFSFNYDNRSGKRQTFLLDFNSLKFALIFCEFSSIFFNSPECLILAEIPISLIIFQRPDCFICVGLVALIFIAKWVPCWMINNSQKALHTSIKGYQDICCCKRNSVFFFIIIILELEWKGALAGGGAFGINSGWNLRWHKVFFVLPLINWSFKSF